MTRDGSDRGFSMVEVTVAMAVFALIATFMSQLLAGGLKGVLLGKRREIATQEANKTLETARSLAYSAVGLAQTGDGTINTDTAIVTQSGVKSYRSDTTWEPIVWASNPTGHPFNPHQTSVKRGATHLTRYVYVTGVDTDSNGTIDLKRVSVRVTWTEDSSAGKNEVRAQTLINDVPTPQTATTPLEADTTASGGSISVRSARGSVTGLLNAVLPETPVTVSLPTTNGKSTYRAVTDVNCTAKSATLSGVTNTLGGKSVTVTADDDATTNTPTSPASQSDNGLPAVGLGLGDDIDDLLQESTVVSPISCAATVNDTDGAAPADDGLPYEKGTGSALGGTGSLNIIEDLTGLGAAVGSTLNAVTVASAPISQEIDYQTVSGNREVLATASGATGLVNIHKIPGIFADGLVRLDSLSYGASVRGAAGTPSAAPAITAPTVNLRVFDSGNEVTGCASRSGSYCVLSINPSAVGFSGVSINYAHNLVPALAPLVNLIYEIRVDVLPPAKDPVGGVTGANGEKRWSAEYTPIAVSARLKAELTVNPILGLKVLLTDTSVDMNLGTVKAEACAGVAC